mmetsp:Transcript_6868/g.19942  ORF Transcript_6868/g.19942 Transcript_6868/m.19942 type:complete len:218 (+) Transcript_6868:3-656(+)
MGQHGGGPRWHLSAAPGGPAPGRGRHRPPAGTPHAAGPHCVVRVGDSGSPEAGALRSACDARIRQAPPCLHDAGTRRCCIQHPGAPKAPVHRHVQRRRFPSRPAHQQRHLQRGLSPAGWQRSMHHACLWQGPCRRPRPTSHRGCRQPTTCTICGRWGQQHHNTHHTRPLRRLLRTWGSLKPRVGRPCSTRSVAPAATASHNRFEAMPKRGGPPHRGN